VAASQTKKQKTHSRRNKQSRSPPPAGGGVLCMCHGVCAIVCVRKCVRACACVYASSAAERLGSFNNGHICFSHTTSYSTRRQGRAVKCPWLGARVMRSKTPPKWQKNDLVSGGHGSTKHLFTKIPGSTPRPGTKSPVHHNLLSRWPVSDLTVSEW